MIRCGTRASSTPASSRRPGVPVRLSRYDGMVHGFFAMTRQLGRARDAHAEPASALRAAFYGR
jgi:acetyl esterase